MSRPFENHLEYLRSPDLFKEGRVVLIGGKSSGKSALIKRFRETWATPDYPKQAHDQNGSVRIVTVLDLRDYKGQTPGQIWSRLFNSLSRELDSRITGLSLPRISAEELDAYRFGQELNILLAPCGCVTVEVVVALKRVHLLEDSSWLAQDTAQQFLLSLKGVWDTCQRCNIAWIICGEPGLLVMADNLAKLNVAGSTWIQEAKVCYFYNLGIEQTRQLLKEAHEGIDEETVKWVYQQSGGQIKIVDMLSKTILNAMNRGQDVASEEWRAQTCAELLTTCSGTFRIWHDGLSQPSLACVDRLRHEDVITIGHMNDSAAIQCACTGFAAFDNSKRTLRRANALFWQWFSTQGLIPQVPVPKTSVGATIDTTSGSKGQKNKIPKLKQQVIFDWNTTTLFHDEDCTETAASLNPAQAAVLRLLFTKIDGTTRTPISHAQAFDLLSRVIGDFPSFDDRTKKSRLRDIRRGFGNIAADLGLPRDAIMQDGTRGTYPKGQHVFLKSGQEDKMPLREDFINNPKYKIRC
jgi:hypothetical protein